MIPVTLCRLQILFLIMVFCMAVQANTEADLEFRETVRVVLRKHCTSCHNEADKKGGINLDAFDFVVHVVRRGELFQKVVEQVHMNQMPPSNSPRMSEKEKAILIEGINKILSGALAKPDPGQAIMRRLSHREYEYTIKDLMGLDFSARNFLPSDASGGEGFDNQSSVLYVTPLTMERYYLAADSILRHARSEKSIWQKIGPVSYTPGIFRRTYNQLISALGYEIRPWAKPILMAEQVILPFAQKAFRRFLTKAEKDKLLSFFTGTYFPIWDVRHGFEEALAITLKGILVSPHFLYRYESNLPLHQPYPVNNFELATRLSYLLWSSLPDEELFEVAYREDLHHPDVLQRETLRMMADPKFKRFAESFAPQWLGVGELIQNPKTDKTLFPEFGESLRQAMYQEVIEFFDYVFNHKKDLKQLISSDFCMVNKTLADHYEIRDVEGDHFRPVPISDSPRGGILGMGAVLTSTSLPTRTSPVIRGQWVLEEILGTTTPPPPPDVPELEAAKKDAEDELDLRKLLEIHRADLACQGCHKKMDPLGLGLENFDAIGRWRTSYSNETKIDASGVLENGTPFNGPTELKVILLQEKEKFARTFARKMLSFALGRGIGFLDTPTLEKLTENLLRNNFNSETFMLELVKSYPFRHRRSDMVDLYLES